MTQAQGKKELYTVYDNSYDNLCRTKHKSLHTKAQPQKQLMYTKIHKTSSYDKNCKFLTFFFKAKVVIS